MTEGLDCRRDETTRGVLVLTFDRPRAANAINPAMSAAFCTALRDATGDASVTAVVLTGVGDRVFSAGADLKNPDNLPPGALGELRAAALFNMIRSVLDFPKPLVAGVNGVAAGAGAMLALLADRVVVAEAARFTFPEIDVGMPTPLGLAILADLGGAAFAADLVQTGRPMPAEEAARRGLAVVVPGEAVRAAALEAARALAAKPAAAFGVNKAWLQQVRRGPIEAAIAAAQAARG
jgi:enoyl-CoA hydratase/carnithine racemase